MPKVIVFTKPGHTNITVRHLVLADRLPGETEEQQADRNTPVLADNPPEGVSPYMLKAQAVRRGLTFTPLTHVVVDRIDVPASKRWREAWQLSGGVVSVGLPEARLIRRAELLLRRRAWLAKLDLLIDTAVAKGQTVRAAQLRTKRTNALAKDREAIDADLAGVSDLATLDTFTPAVLVDDEPDPD